ETRGALSGKPEKSHSRPTSGDTVIPAHSGIPYNCVGSCLTWVFADIACRFGAMLMAFARPVGGQHDPFFGIAGGGRRGTQVRRWGRARGTGLSWVNWHDHRRAGCSSATPWDG